jgi:hypothetical protein
MTLRRARDSRSAFCSTPILMRNKTRSKLAAGDFFIVPILFGGCPVIETCIYPGSTAELRDTTGLRRALRKDVWHAPLFSDAEHCDLRGRRINRWLQARPHGERQHYRFRSSWKSHDRALRMR